MERRQDEKEGELENNYSQWVYSTFNIPWILSMGLHTFLMLLSLFLHTCKFFNGFVCHLQPLTSFFVALSSATHYHTP